MATHGIIIPAWHPARLNQLLGHWARAAKIKRADRAIVAAYVRMAGLPRATGKRRVGLRIVLGPRQRAGDPDCYHKSLCDALTACGMLVDDSRQWVELLPVRFDRDVTARCEITLEDCE
jgi:Holliday junction resolvase RusA-like endonuclease